MENLKIDFYVSHIGGHIKIVASDKPIVNEVSWPIVLHKIGIAL